MSEENKALSRRVSREVFGQGNLAVVDEVYAPDYVDHNAPPLPDPGVEGFKQRVTMFRTAFPDASVTIEDQIAEGDRVVTHWTGHGTHTGEFAGGAPTNKEITVTGMSVDRIVNGKIVESW